MKHKIKKEYIKTNLIGFIIAGIIVSGGFVFAAVTFPSNEVSYSNGTSGLKSTDVQGAIDELYETCTQTAGSQIIENAGLEKDPYECRYFFKGANPNNYIKFNNETWRIISVECDDTIKIMRDADINTSDSIEWDSSNRSNWARPASLNTHLNETYYNSLTSTAQSQIVTKDWSIGGVIDDHNDLAGQINDENSSKWNGKVALVTLSEYIRSNSNKSSCGTFSLNNDNYNYSSCKNTTWMYYSSGYWWTLTPHISTYSSSVFTVNIPGFISNVSARSSNVAVRPAVYLNSEVKIIGGDGSQSNPYTIK